MADRQPDAWEIARLEYETALDQYKHVSTLRRQDMGFATTVQAAILTIIGQKLLSLDIASFFLSLIAFIVLLIGINSERRLSAYMTAYMNRVKAIEEQYGMALLSISGRNVQQQRLLLPNAIVFPVYYGLFGTAWLVIWLVNLLK